MHISYRLCLLGSHGFLVYFGDVFLRHLSTIPQGVCLCILSYRSFFLFSLVLFLGLHLRVVLVGLPLVLLLFVLGVFIFVMDAETHSLYIDFSDGW